MSSSTNAPDQQQQEQELKEQEKTTTSVPVDVEKEEEGEKENETPPTTTSEEEQKGPPPVPWTQLFRYADQWDVTMYIIGSFFAIVSGGGMPAFSEIFGRFINVLTTTNPEDTINELALVMTYVALARGLCGFFAISFFMIPCERQSSRIRTLYVEALLRQEMTFHDKSKPGALSASLVGDIQVFRNGTNDKLAMGIISLSMFLFGLILGFIRSWRLTLVSLSVLPLIAIGAFFMRKFVVSYILENRKAFSTAGEISDEAFQNFRTLQILGLEDATVKKFEDALEGGRWSGLMKDVSINLSTGVITFIMFSSYSLLFYYSKVLVLDGTHDIGELVTVFFALLIGSFGLAQVGPTIGGLAEASGAIAKVFEVLDNEPKMVSGTKKIPAGQFKGEIIFENVEFTYPTKSDMKLLKGLDLKIDAGTTVAFSGASGCGKSTFIGLVQRLYDPLEGRVLIDGVDLKELDLDWFRSNVGVVSQEPVLFSGSLKENVKFGKPDATDEEVIAACKMAAIHDTIMSLPDGYDTAAGSVGSQLSGGQKQRIAIARALILKPKILILDEATSALDRASEVQVQKAIDKLVSVGGFTVLVIAHRLATIASADVIHFMERDEAVGSDIVESGSFKELMAKEGHFYSMASRQAKSAAAHIDGDDEDEDEDDFKNEDGNPMNAHEKILTADDKPDVTIEPIGGSAAAGTSGIVVRTSSTGAGSKNTSFTSEAAALGGKKSKGGMSRENTTTSVIAVGGGDDGEKKKKEEMTEEERKKKENALTEVKEKEEESAEASLFRVAAMMKDDRWMVAIGILGSLLVGGQMPFYAIVFTKVIAILGLRDPAAIENEITLWICLFLVVAGIALIGNGLQSFYAVAGEKLTTVLRVKTFRAILRQDATFFDMPGRDPGGLQSLLSGDCESVHQLFGPSIGPTVQLIGTLGAGLGISFYYSWRIALVVLSTMPILAFAGGLRSKIYNGFAKPMDEKNPAATIFGESMRNIRTVVAFNAAKRQRDAFEEADSHNVEEGIKVSWIAALSYGFMQLSMTGIFALSLWYAGKVMRDHGLSFFDAFVALMSLIMAGMGGGEAAGLLARQKDAQIGAKRCFAVFDRIPDVHIYAEGGKANSFEATPEHSIEFKNTDFTYPSRPKMPVLKGFSKKLQGSKSYGLIGSTGSGKSTIISLLSRFYDPFPDKDTIEVDGDKLTSLDLTQWRSKIAAVFQEPSLFSGTVKENILLGVNTDSDKITDEELKIACVRAALWSTIEEWPKGFNTEVGYRGCQLSGGQKQRVALARAFLRRPQILLMDESTSALDQSTEVEVLDGLQEMSREHQMTTISVAHRLSTIKNCDEILLLDQGIVLESGTHQELIELGKEYKKRWDLFVQATA